MMLAERLFLLAIVGLSLTLFACTESTSDALDGGGLEPPPGFLERVDANCRAAAELAISADAPSVRQLNGQSLLTYALAEGGTAQCAVRHADESVIDVRVVGSE